MTSFVTDNTENSEEQIENRCTQVFVLHQFSIF